MLGIVITKTVVDCKESRDAVFEAIEVLLVRLCPEHFGEGCHAREFHVLHLSEVEDILGPEIGLSTDYEVGFIACEFCRDRLETIHFFHRDIATDCKRLVLHIFRLVEIEIEVSVGRQNHLIAAIGTFNGTVIAAPRGYNGIARDVAFEDFVPSNHHSAALFDYVIGEASYIALETVFG